jgi:hypothetical protein
MLKRMIATACLCAAVVEAQAFDLTGQQIKVLVAGATAEIDTPVGTKLPVRYGRDGKLFGEARDLAWYLGAATDRGRWWVAGDQLCHKWSRWLGSQPQCLRLSKAGRVIRWRTRDGHTGTARITARVAVPASTEVAAVAPPAQTGRMKDAALPQPAGVPEPKAAPKQSPGGPAGAGKQPAAAVKEAATPPPMPAPAAPEKGPAPQEQAEETPQKRAEPSPAAKRLYKVAKVRSGDVLNVRGGPSADFAIVGVLGPGSRGIAITSTCRMRWCPVRHGAASGWVHSAYLVPDEAAPPATALGGSADAPRSCLTAAARDLLDRIEQQFGPVQVVSTCRLGATIPGTRRSSRHASGNAVDFKAGSRKAAILAWLVANHRGGGTMTYPGMDHIHVDIGPRFASIANGPRWRSWRDSQTGSPRPR